MDATEIKKRRSANFSANDCILLANIMGQPSKLQEKLTNYQLHKHKFTSYITSSTKKSNWLLVVETFNSMAEVSRKPEDLLKKWDNLVQTHRSKYQDFQKEQSATGGGPRPGSLPAVTEAVMDVIGRRGENMIGVAGSSSNDSSQILLERLAQKTSDQNKATEENDIISEFVFTDDLENLIPLQTSKPSLSSAISSSCKKCQCSECVSTRQLKKRKLELQIRYFLNIEQ